MKTGTKFLEKGIYLYGEAQDTILEFKKGIRGLISSALHERKSWHPLKPKPPEISDCESKGSAEDGWQISVWIEGRTGRTETVRIQCGIWWNPPELEQPQPIIFARYKEAPRGVREFRWPDKNKWIRSTQFSDWDGTFLYVTVPKPFDVKGPLSQLLDALLSQLP